MNVSELKKIAHETLSEIAEHPGGILYSAVSTLKPGKAYLLGHNPGGSGGAPLRNSIETLATGKTNAYIDEAWENEAGQWKEGEAPLQTRVRWLLSALGLKVREVCASNLIFVQTKSAADVSRNLAETCWPVHEAILQIVRPHVIVTFGNSRSFSPFTFLHRKLGGQIKRIPAGHGNWIVKGFYGWFPHGKVFVVGLPHLSRYKVTEKYAVTEWIKNEGRIKQSVEGDV